MRLIGDKQSSDLYRYCKDYRMIFSTNEKVYNKVIPIIRKPVYVQVERVWDQRGIISREVRNQHEIS